MLSDQQIGQILVKAGRLSELALSAVVEEQKRLNAQGKPARLGELLVSRGLVTPKDIQDVLAKQAKVIAACEGCGSRFNIVAWQAGKKYRCGKCQGELHRVEEASDVSVSGSNFMPSVAGDENPALSRLVEQAKKCGTQKKLGKYLLVKELGRGGMGVVYQGFEENLRRSVAIKVLLSGDDDRLKQRFLREARLVSQLRHPNIVAVHELGEDQGRAFFTMDFIDGGPLTSLISPNRVPAREMLKIVATIARALDYAHAKGTVHRDIKPQNILVTPDGTPFLTDFGLARDIESNTRLTMSGAVMGTPSYMSPEQARGGGSSLDAKTDIYSLGAVLYEGLTGRAPFDGSKDLVGLLEAIVRDDPVPPSQVVPGVPKAAETICLKAMAKQADRRYASAGAMADDIDRFLTGQAIQAKPVGRVEKGATWLKRNPVAAVGGAAAALVVAIAGFFFWRAGAIEERERKERLADSEKQRLEHDDEKARLAQVAKERQEELERKLKELETKLAGAKTEEEKERLRKEIADAGGKVENGGTVEPPKSKPWSEFEKQLAAWRYENPGNLGGAIALVEGFEVAETDRAARDVKIAALRGEAKQACETARAAALAVEETQDWAKAIEAWRAVIAVGIADASKEAESRIADLTTRMTEADAVAGAAELKTLRRTVWGLLGGGDFASAAAAVADVRARFPALAADLDEIAWASDMAEAFAKAAVEVVAAGGESAETWRLDGEVLLLGLDGDKVRIRTKEGAEIRVAYRELKPKSLADLAKKGSSPEVGAAFFWHFYYHEKMGKDAEFTKEYAKSLDRRNRVLDRLNEQERERAKKVLADFDASWAEDPAPVADPVAADPGETPPAEAPKLFAVDSVDDGGVPLWRYDFDDAAQARDWMMAPRSMFQAKKGYGVRVDGGALVAQNAWAGWVGCCAQGALVVEVAGVEGFEGEFGVALAGYEIAVHDGSIHCVAPDGRFLHQRPVPQAMRGKPFRFEIALTHAAVKFAYALDGESAATVLSENGIDAPPMGPTGVFAARDSAIRVAGLEIRALLPEDWLRQYRDWRAALARVGAEWTTGPAEALEAKGSRLKTRGSWGPKGGFLTARSDGNSPAQACEAFSPCHRNFRLRFRYQGSALQVSMNARGAEDRSRLEFWLPTDLPGQAREVEIVAVERVVACTVDGGPMVFMKDPLERAATGDLVLRVHAGELQVLSLTLEEIQGVPEVGPGHPWPRPGREPAGPPEPGREPVAEQLFNGNDKGGFKTSQCDVRDGELVVRAEIETERVWNEGTFEMEFTADAGTAFRVAHRCPTLVKCVPAKGAPHTLRIVMRMDGAEATLDGKSLKIEGRPQPADASLRIKIERGAIRIKSMTLRPGPGGAGPGPGPDDKGPKPK